MLSAPWVQAMTYHKNDVYFLAIHDSAISEAAGNDPRVLLYNGSFTIQEKSITSGQDPKNLNKIGEKKVFSCTGKEQVIRPNGDTYMKNCTPRLGFHVGRKGKKSNANWFKQRVKANQTTFNQLPNKLNFAFKGELSLLMNIPHLGGYGTYVFPDVILAQGHTGASNNWWFAGQACRHISRGSISCRGINPKGQNIELIFRRGSDKDKVNQIIVDLPNES